MEKIDHYLRAGWWEEKNVPQASPLLCIPKKDGRLRTVVDCRERNLNTVKDLTPFPDQDMIRNDVARAPYRTKLDMSDAYEQVRVEPDDVKNSAFSTIVGTFLSHVIQQGDCNAPATFQRLMTRIFRRYIGKFVYIYLDDIFIFSYSLEDHESHLDTVFSILREQKLYLSAKKVDLYSERMDCLGHLIDRRGLHADGDKMKSVRHWPKPRDYNDVQKFLGMINYLSQFMPDVSVFTSPLSGMSRMKVWRWTPLHEKCFENLKVMACRSPILRPIDYERAQQNGEFIFLICDASISGIGSYYGQGRDWETCRPAGFLSKKFSTAQASYRTYEQETLAILEGLLRWEDKLLGRKIVIITDHRTLEFFNTQRSLSFRQTRWYEYLSRFDYSIQYVEGLKNVVADALSRMYAGRNTDIPIDDWVNADVRLDPEGETLPIDRLLESRAMQLRPRVQKPASAVPRDAVEPRVEESRLMRSNTRGLEQSAPPQRVRFAEPPVRRNRKSTALVNVPRRIRNYKSSKGRIPSSGKGNNARRVLRPRRHPETERTRGAVGTARDAILPGMDTGAVASDSSVGKSAQHIVLNDAQRGLPALEAQEERVVSAAADDVKGPSIGNTERQERLERISREEDVAWNSGSPGTPLRVHLEGEDFLDVVRKGYSKDVLFSKIISNVAHHP